MFITSTIIISSNLHQKQERSNQSKNSRKHSRLNLETLKGNIALFEMSMVTVIQLKNEIEEIRIIKDAVSIWLFPDTAPEVLLGASSTIPTRFSLKLGSELLRDYSDSDEGSQSKSFYTLECRMRSAVSGFGWSGCNFWSLCWSWAATYWSPLRKCLGLIFRWFAWWGRRSFQVRGWVWRIFEEH